MGKGGNMETPARRFNRRCKEMEIDFTQYIIACPKHGNKPAVYDSNINGYDCRVCIYHAVMDKAGKYHVEA